MTNSPEMPWATHGRTGEVHLLIGGIQTKSDGQTVGHTLCGGLSGSFGWYAQDDWNKRCSSCATRQR
jgi:hypothetical protein